jgi:hypothetical protein
VRDTAFFSYLDDVDHRDVSRADLPSVLVRERKIDGTPNLNHIAYLRANEELLEVYGRHLSTTPLMTLVRNYVQNVRIYFQPSSQFTPHVIVDRLPWRALYDRVFSFPVLPGLIIVAGVSRIVARRRAGSPDYGADLALAVPGLFIALVSVIGDKGENMRFKFFLEPVMFVFIASWLYDVVNGWRVGSALTPREGSAATRAKR